MKVLFIGYEWRRYKLSFLVRKHNIRVSNTEVGEVSHQELSVVMQCLGYKQTELELQAFIRRTDTCGKGMINYIGRYPLASWLSYLGCRKLLNNTLTFLNTDFMSMMASVVNKVASDRDIVEAFTVFDRDSVGVISPNELRFVWIL